MPRKLTGKPTGRPPKMMGPVTVAQTKAGSNGPQVRNVRKTDTGQDRTLLPPASAVTVPDDEEVRVFPTAQVSDEQRSGGPNALPAFDGTPEQRISVLVKKILGEVAAKGFQDNGSRRTNAEVLTRQLVTRAMEGNQFAIEAVLDRAEGKPVKGVTVSTPDMSVEEMIGQQEVALLNNLTKKDK